MRTKSWKPRIDLITNETGAKIAKWIDNVNPLVERSPLPKATWDLVIVRASQI